MLLYLLLNFPIFSYILNVSAKSVLHMKSLKLSQGRFAVRQGQLKEFENINWGS